MKYLDRLKKLGYANFRELYIVGIKEIYNMGMVGDVVVKVIETIDGTQWEYNLKDEIFDMKLEDEPRVTQATFN